MIGRIAFLGTGAFGVPLLERLADRADELLVVSQPARPAGRGLRPRHSPVADVALRRGLTLVTPARLRSDEGRAALRHFSPDGLVLAAYGQLVPPDLLALAPRRPLNVHPSLLPRHRGATPVAATILAGDHQAGVTLMVMVAQLDAGPIVAQWPVALDGTEQAPELEARLAALAGDTVPPLLSEWAAGRLPERPQDERLATLTRPLRRADGWIEWRRDATEIDRQVRALQPWPGAWTTVNGRRLHVRRAMPAASTLRRVTLEPGTLMPGEPVMVACGTGTLELVTVQPEGRAAMPADAWLRGLGERRVTLGGPVTQT